MMMELGQDYLNFDENILCKIDEIIAAQKDFDPIAHRFAIYYYRNNGALNSKRCPVKGQLYQDRVKTYLQTLVQAEVFPSTVRKRSV